MIYSDPSISGGFVNAGETVVSKTFTLDGSITSANNLTYKVNLKVDTNTYEDIPVDPSHVGYYISEWGNI